MKKTITNAKSLKLFVLSLLSLVLLQVTSLKGQFYDLTDYHDPNESMEDTKGTLPNFSEYGLVHTPQGSLKVLLVFVHNNSHRDLRNK